MSGSQSSQESQASAPNVARCIGDNTGVATRRSNTSFVGTPARDLADADLARVGRREPRPHGKREIMGYNAAWRESSRANTWW